MPKNYLRKDKVAVRYDTTKRTVDRRVKEKKLPPPKYLPGVPYPMWDEDELDANDRKATLEPPQLLQHRHERIPAEYRPQPKRQRKHAIEDHANT
jgi:hypothetical protein